MQKPNLTLSNLLVAAFVLSGCASAAPNVAQPELSQPDLSGDWRIIYNIPDSMVYALNLSVTIEGTELPDQSGAWSEPEDLNSRVSEGVVDGTSVRLRWIYQNVGANGELGPVVWDHNFEGQYELDENGSGVLRGTLLGTEINGYCEHPVPGLTPAVPKLPNGECPRHEVTGTWYAKRDVLS